MNSSGQANQARAGSQNAKYECKAAKFNRKRPLLPPVGISGTAPNKNRSLLRPVRQLSQKCRSLYFGWKKWRHGVYSSSLLLNNVLNKDQAHMSALLRNSGLRLCGHRRNQKWKAPTDETILSSILSSIFPNSHRSSCKKWGLESAVRFRDELEEDLAKVTSLGTEEE